MHTPGPYLIADDEYKNFVYFLNDDGTNRIGIAVNGGWIEQGMHPKDWVRTPREEIEATTILLRAAPEMLEMLQRIANLPGDYNLLHDPEFLISDVKSLIQKATTPTP